MVGSIDIGISTQNVVGYGTKYIGYREVKYFPNYRNTQLQLQDGGYPQGCLSRLLCCLGIALAVEMLVP